MIPDPINAATVGAALKKFHEESGSTVSDTRPPILRWPATSWPDHHDGVNLDTVNLDTMDYHNNHGEIRQLLDTWARVWGAGGQAILHLHTLEGRARAKVFIPVCFQVRLVTTLSL